MLTTNKVSITLALSIGSWCLLLCTPAMAGEKDGEIKTILNDWEMRQQQIRTLQCSVVGEGLVPKGTYTNDMDLPASLKGKTLPEQDYRFEKKAMWYFHFENNQVRKEETDYSFYPAQGVISPSMNVFISDGVTAKHYEPKDKNSPDSVPRSGRQPELYLESADAARMFFNHFDIPILLGCGIIPTNDRALDPRRLRIPLDGKKFYLHGKGVREGIECLILRSYPAQNQGAYFDELWVDRGRESAILWWTVSHQKEGVHASNDIQYKRYSFGWFPQSWTTTLYNQHTHIIQLSIHVRVTEVKVNFAFDADRLNVMLQPGMIVMDTAKNRLYEVDQDGKGLIDITDTNEPQKSRKWTWVVVLCVFGVIMAAFIFRSTRRRRNVSDH